MLVEKAKILGKVLIGIWIAPKLIGAMRVLIAMIGSVSGAILKTAKISSLAAGAMATAIVVGVAVVASAYAKLQMTLFKYRMEQIRVMESSKASAKLFDEIKEANKEYQESLKKGDAGAQIQALEKLKRATETMADMREHDAQDRISEAEEYKDELDSTWEKSKRAFRMIGAKEGEEDQSSFLKEQIKLKEEESRRDQHRAGARRKELDTYDKELKRLKEIEKQKNKPEVKAPGGKVAKVEDEAKHKKKLDAEIARLKIDQIKNESKKKLALLELEYKEEMDAAEKAGLSKEKIQEKYRLLSNAGIPDTAKQAQQVQFVGLQDMYKKLATAGENRTEQEMLNANKEQVRILKAIDEKLQTPSRNNGAPLRIK